MTEYLESLDPPLPTGSVTFERATPTAEYGEPRTLIVVLSLVALRAFVSWLVLRPRNSRVTQQVTVTLTDGTVITKTLDVAVSEPGEGTPELIKELLAMPVLTPQARDGLSSALSDR